MRANSSRLSPKSYISAKFGDDSLKELPELIENALILNPKMPSAEVAETIAKELDRDALYTLAIQPLAKLVRAVRSGQSVKHRQPPLPGFEHLPLRIPVSPDGSRAKLLNANTYGVREYCRVLMKSHRDRKKNDPKVKEAYALLEKMQRAARTEKGITVRQVLALER